MKTLSLECIIKNHCTEWLHLTPIVLISQDHPNHRFGGIVAHQFDVFDYMVLKSNCNSIINICKKNII